MPVVNVSLSHGDLKYPLHQNPDSPGGQAGDREFWGLAWRLSFEISPRKDRL